MLLRGFGLNFGYLPKPAQAGGRRRDIFDKPRGSIALTVFGKLPGTGRQGNAILAHNVASGYLRMGILGAGVPRTRGAIRHISTCNNKLLGFELFNCWCRS